MPTKPLGPCTTPGCPGRAVDHGKCAQHAAERRAAYDAQRGTAAERGYGQAWAAESEEYLEAHPYCAGVLINGKRTHAPGCDGMARVTDHVIPRRAGGSDNWANYQPLSRECHSLKTAKEDGRWAARARG